VTAEPVQLAEALIGAGALALAAALVSLVVRLAATGTLRRNAWAGIRLPATMRSDAAWAAGHRAAVRFTDVAALGALVGAGVAVAVRDERGLLFGVLGGGAWLVVWLVVGARRSLLAARGADGA
jgi:uncharacterized membrane protein